MRFGFITLTVTLIIGSSLTAQTTSDPQAILLASQSYANVTGGKTVIDVTLAATVTRVAGADYQSGAAALSAKRTTASRVELTLGGETSVEIRNAAQGAPHGAWALNGGPLNAYADHNCWTDAVWFFPALLSLANVGNSDVLVQDLGSDTWQGLSTRHLVLSRTSVPIQRLSAMDLYLDPATLLPLGVKFFVHPDDDLTTNIPEEIRYADYHAVNGAQVPFRIQQLVNGELVLDLVVTTVAMNTGLSDAQFSIQ